MHNTQLRPRILLLLLIILITACAPEMVEEDDRDSTAASPKEASTMKSEADYINRAIVVGALGKDSIGDHEQAMLLLDSAIIVNPKSARAYQYQALIYGDQQKFSDALVVAKKSVIADASDPKSMLARATVYLEMDHRDSALTDYYTARDLDPENGQIWEAIGYLECQKGNKQLGLQCLTKARDLGYLPVNRGSDKRLCDAI